jgi:heme/copper-type cytochrome/quinol oxidase subunit 2
MDRCDALVAVIFIVAGALVYYAIYWRCNSTLVDVERASARRHVVEWYVTRASSVILVIGAIVSARHVATTSLRRLRFARPRMG